MPAQSDLFDTPMLSGLAHRDAIVSSEEEQALITAIATIPLAPFRFQGWLGKRETASFGWHYDFDAAQFAPADPIPEFLQPLRARATAFAGLHADDLVQTLVTRYDPGAGIGWHRDRPVFGQVVGVSLGVPAILRFRRRVAGGFERRALPIAPRSIYHLSGEARTEWEHSIAEMAETRWSITFRTLAVRPPPRAS